MATDGLKALAADPLLQALLQNAQVCDLRLERLFTMVRHALLEAATETAAGGDPDEPTLAFYCNVARQCFFSEYVYSFDADEESRAQRLRERLAAALQSGEAVPAIWVAAVAAYFPLAAEPFADALRQRDVARRGGRAVDAADRGTSGGTATTGSACAG